MPFDECMDDDSTARKMDKSLFLSNMFVTVVRTCSFYSEVILSSLLIEVGYIVQCRGLLFACWCRWTSSESVRRKCSCVIQDHSSFAGATSTQKHEKKGAAKYDNCAGNKSKSFANIPVIPSFIADFDTQRWTNGQITPNSTPRLSKSQFRTESQKTKTKMFRWFWQKLWCSVFAATWRNRLFHTHYNNTVIWKYLQIIPMISYQCEQC